jgi:hypothetical protein
MLSFKSFYLISERSINLTKDIQIDKNSMELAINKCIHIIQKYIDYVRKIKREDAQNYNDDGHIDEYTHYHAKQMMIQDSSSKKWKGWILKINTNQSYIVKFYFDIGYKLLEKDMGDYDPDHNKLKIYSHEFNLNEPLDIFIFKCKKVLYHELKHAFHFYKNEYKYDYTTSYWNNHYEIDAKAFEVATALANAQVNLTDVPRIAKRFVNLDVYSPKSKKELYKKIYQYYDNLTNK